MLTALIFICTLASAPDTAQCDRDSASDVLIVPQSFSNPAACFFAGQAYLASTPLGAFDPSAYRLRIVCMPDHVASDLARTKPPKPRTRRPG